MNNNRQLYLRDVHSGDSDLMLEWENDIENWRVSGTTEEYTRMEIETLINELLDPEQKEQTRKMICLADPEEVIGTVDLFSIDEENKKAGVGILIGAKEQRGKGYAQKALKLIEEVAINEFDIRKLECSIHNWNKDSLKLFDKSGYRTILDDGELIYLEKWLKK